ncbi:MAG: NlpC/P60 family protein [Armatimonas sp.]
MKKYAILLGISVTLLGLAAAKDPLFARRSDSAITLSDGRSFSTLYRAGFPGGRGPVAVMDKCVWWGTADKLFRRDLTTERTEVYLPWAGASGEVRWLTPLADGSVTVTTTDGEYGIDPMNADGESGYGGYVRARLGDDTEVTPEDPRLKKLAGAIEDWQGVPYLYGGTTRKGVDCSAFVGAAYKAAGMTLPRTSKDIGLSERGLKITDELEWGDVLVYPGHVAIYLGNGKTAETRGTTVKPGQVGKSSIWLRKEVIVRRFLR